MEPKMKKTAKPTEENLTTLVEKKAAVTPIVNDTKSIKKSIPAKVAKTARGVRTVKVALKDKKAEAVTPTEPIRKVSPAKVITAPAVVETAKIDNTPKPARSDLSKPTGLSAGQRTYIRRLKQLAHQEGTTFHSPFVQRALAK